MKEQTALDWFYDKIKSHFEHDGDLLETFNFTFAIAKDKEKQSMQEYADEQSVAFAEFVLNNVRDMGVNDGKNVIWIYKDWKQFTSAELLEIFKKEKHENKSVTRRN